MNASKPPKILIADDNDLMRSLLRGILRSENYNTINEAKNGLQAVAAVDQHRPDLVFLDVMMPEMDGLEALRAIKEKYPATLVVMITGNPSKENVEESIQNGASGFIIKPFNSAKVLDTLNRVLPAARHRNSG